MLPPAPTYNEEFRQRGIPDVVKIEAFPLNGADITVIFESARVEERRQGVWLKTDAGIWIEGEMCPSVELWYDTAPEVVSCQCLSADKRLYLYNIWEANSSRGSLSYGSGMLVEQLPNGRRYRCNDIGFETSFDKLVFRIEQN